MNLLTRTNLVRCLVGAALATPLLAAASPASGATVPSVCTRYVAPGVPTGSGTSEASPMSLTALMTYLNGGPRPGAVACLTGGSYGSATTTFTLTKGGTVGAPVSIIEHPAATTDAVIAGRIVIARGADNVVVGKLHLVGPGTGTASAYSIDANNVEFVGNDISAPNRICISVGGGLRSATTTSPKVTGFVADGNRVHDCGTNLAKTGSPQAHGLYLEYSSGAVVRNNLIRNPVGRGVQLFNDADGSLIENNIFDGNFAAVNFGGGTMGSASVDPRPENNVVQHNIVTNGVRWCNTSNQCQRALFVQGYHAASDASPPSNDPQTKVGATWGNVVRSNCVWFASSAVAVPYNDWEPGYRYETTNKFIDPQYNNGSVGDFRLKATSPCLGTGPRPILNGVSASATKTSITTAARLRSPIMTATYRLQVRLCATTITTVTSTVPCNGSWVNSTVAATAATDDSVNRTVSGLLANRIYEYRMVSWQALLSAPGPSVDYTATTQYWTATAPLKVKTPV